MSFGGGKSDSSSQQSQSFNQNIPAFQANALNSLYGNASNLFKALLPQMQSYMPQALNSINGINKAAMPTYQNQLHGGAFGGLNIGNQLMSSLNSSFGNPTQTSKVYADIMGGSGNNYADALKASYTHDADLAAKHMLQNLDARATASGMSGGSRHGIAEGLGIQGINSNLQQNLAKVGYDTFQQDLTNKLNIAQQADQGTLQRQQMLASLLGQQNQASQGALNAGMQMQNMALGGFAPFMAPWNMLGQYSNILGNPIILSNGSGSGFSSGSGFNLGLGLE